MPLLHTVDALILALVIDVMKVAQDLDHAHMRSCVINHAL